MRCEMSILPSPLTPPNPDSSNANLVLEEDGLAPSGLEPWPAAETSAMARPDFRAGTAALAGMPDQEFEVRLAAMRRGRERITRIHRELMDPETEYGIIPGTKQPTLLKSGAEKLC